MIKKEQTFMEVLKKYPATAEIFLKAGMHCVGCPMAQMETIEQGCMAHGIDADKFIKNLNKAIKKKK